MKVDDTKWYRNVQTTWRQTKKNFCLDAAASIFMLKVILTKWLKPTALISQKKVLPLRDFWDFFYLQFAELFSSAEITSLSFVSLFLCDVGLPYKNYSSNSVWNSSKVQCGDSISTSFCEVAHMVSLEIFLASRRPLVDNPFKLSFYDRMSF